MNKRMEAVSVHTDEKDGEATVWICQEMGEEASTVILQPEQIDAVCDWLKEAKEEALKTNGRKSDPARNGKVPHTN